MYLYYVSKECLWLPSTHVFCIISDIFVPKYMSIEFQVADRLMYSVMHIPVVPLERAYRSLTLSVTLTDYP